jgi:hypothetical protein
VAVQKVPPGVERVFLDPQREMAWPIRSMWGQQIALKRCFSPERQQDLAFARLKKT